jgi:phosphocarrier protein FPr
VIGIAATSDEHVGVLANLAEVVEDPEAAERFAHTTDPMLIVDRLNRTPVEEA